MGYSGAQLAPGFKATATRAAAIKMTEDGARALRLKVKGHTPIDTGELEASWTTKVMFISTNELGEIVYESGVQTELGYAPDVEYGTGLWGPKHAKYLIEPKNPGGVLHWIGKDGQDVFARRVWHPGSPGAHMVAISVAETEAELQALMLPALEEWVKEQELLMKEGQAR